MLERYVLPDQLVVEREFMPAVSWWQFPARYNVAPGQFVPAIRMHDGQSEGVMMRWGLIPAWAEGRAPAEVTTCADVDTFEQSKIYAPAWDEQRRCILPVAGFYTWRLNRHRYRQPYYVQLNERNVFAVAAIWDHSEGADEPAIESCAVVTVAPNELCAQVTTRPGRMPAILRRRDYKLWLEGTPDEARAALGSYRSEWMQAYAVSPRINSTAPDDADLLRPV